MKQTRSGGKTTPASGAIIEKAYITRPANRSGLNDGVLSLEAIL